MPLANGHWAYLCAFQDRYTEYMVGWQVRTDMPEALVTSALQRALLAQRTAPGLMVRSDRGGQYMGNAYKALLRGAKAQLSHSRRGECDNNAQAENRLKVLGACGPASKPRSWKLATGPYLPT